MIARPLATVALLHLAATMSPGPAFVLVSRTASTSTRKAALGIAAGTVAASVTWAVAALLGVQAILVQMSHLYRAIELLGALYLAWIGEELWRRASAPIRSEIAHAPRDRSDAFVKGLAVGLSNPKVVIFFATIFAAALGPSSPRSWKVAAVCIVLLNESLWYGTVALCFGTSSVRAFYGRIRTVMERVFGALLIAFATKLVWDGAAARS